jgi:hypothetical protein
MEIVPVQFSDGLVWLLPPEISSPPLTEILKIKTKFLQRLNQIFHITISVNYYGDENSLPVVPPGCRI